jgi:hypothetical protein
MCGIRIATTVFPTLNFSTCQMEALLWGLKLERRGAAGKDSGGHVAACTTWKPWKPGDGRLGSLCRGKSGIALLHPKANFPCQPHPHPLPHNLYLQHHILSSSLSNQTDLICSGTAFSARVLPWQGSWISECKSGTIFFAFCFTASLLLHSLPGDPKFHRPAVCSSLFFTLHYLDVY